MRTVLFYSLLQIPGLAILGLALTAAVHFAWLTLPIALGIGLAWLIKDIVMYPFVKSAFAPRDSDDRGPTGLIGKTGTVTHALAPAGFVRVQGELWQARHIDGATELPINRPVRIVEARGMVLFVREAEESLAKSQT